MHALRAHVRVLLTLPRLPYLTLSRGKPGESLEDVARTFSTDWLQLFSANSHIHTPQKLPEYQLLNLGALYPVRPG